MPTLVPLAASDMNRRWPVLSMPRAPDAISMGEETINVWAVLSHVPPVALQEPVPDQVIVRTAYSETGA